MRSYNGEYVRQGYWLYLFIYFSFERKNKIKGGSRTKRAAEGTPNWGKIRKKKKREVGERG